MRYELTGPNKALTVDDSGIHIKSDPFKEERFIPFRSVLSVSVRKPAMAMVGYIFFQTAGASDPLGGGDPDKIGSAVSFKKQEQYDIALQIMGELEKILSGGGVA